MTERGVITGQSAIAKGRYRPYRSGRSPDWIKVKNSGTGRDARCRIG
jgi:ATP-dependent DNA ligase